MLPKVNINQAGNDVQSQIKYLVKYLITLVRAIENQPNVAKQSKSTVCVTDIKYQNNVLYITKSDGTINTLQVGE